MGPHAQASTLCGRVLDGRYRIESLLGLGGMGAVYRGRHVQLDQIVAIKVLLPDLATDETAARRFVREAKSTFRLDHPHCVRVTDFGAGEGVLYLVMEYLDGRTVERELAVDGPMSSARCAHVLAQVASALAYAHGRGLVHRDLKSENIMLIQRDGDPDFAKVLDFGLAKLWDPEGGGLATLMSLSPLTEQGITFGTPNYMSPEQARGEVLGPASDIFSLGTVAYEMLTGQLPFQHPNPVQVLTSIVVDEPVPLGALRADIDPELEGLVMQCLSKDPAARPGPALVLADRLRALRSRRVSPAPARATLVSSETVELQATPVPPGAGAVSQPPAPAAMSAPADTRAVIAAGVQRPSKVWLAAGAMAIIGAISAIAILRPGGGPARPGVEAAPAAPPTTTPAPDDPVGATSPTVDAGLRQIPAQLVQVEAPDAAPAPANAAPKTNAAAAPPLTDKQRRARTLVSEARAATDTLGRMAKADAALRLDPSNPEAHFLFGDALVTSGNRARGCQHLRRAFRLRSARRRYAEERCGEGGD